MRLIRPVLLAFAVAISTVATSGSLAPTLAAAMTEPAYVFEDVAAIPSLTDVHARVFRLYWAFFDRQPDAEGALYWANQNNQCWSLERIANFFATSDEFVATYGTLTDAEFVDLIYRNVLDRTAEPAGRVFWEGEIASGARTRVQVMLDFAYSDEFVRNHPLPSDGKTDRPCSTNAASLPEPSTANAVTVASLQNITIPTNTCFGSTVDPGNDVLVDGRTATNADGSWAELATGTGNIAALRLPNVAQRAFTDVNDDGNVDALVGIYCRTLGGAFDQIALVMFVHGDGPIRLPYTQDAFLTSGEEPLGVNAVLARNNGFDYSFDATLNITIIGGFTWNDDPCCPAIQFMSRFDARGRVIPVDKYSPSIAANRLINAVTDGDPYTNESDTSPEIYEFLQRELPPGSTTTDFRCQLVESFHARCGFIASTGPAIQFDLRPNAAGRWIASDNLIFI